MSSDLFADLGATLGSVAVAVDELVDRNKQAAHDSRAQREAHGEPHAGDWGPHPGRDLQVTVVLLTWSCTDHLDAAARMLSEGHAITSLYTLIRGAAETASLARYLSATDIDSVERVRRSMNFELGALVQDINMRKGIPGEEAKVERHRARIDAIRRTGEDFGLPYTEPKRDYQAGYLGSEPPSATDLIGQCVSGEPGYRLPYQLLSGVAHGQLHGLSKFLVQLPVQADPGGVFVHLKADAGDLAGELITGPACIARLVAHLQWYLGWDTAEVDPPVQSMLATWSRIARLPSVWQVPPIA